MFDVGKNMNDDLLIKKGPNLIEDNEEELQLRKETEEDEDMKYNIQQISKAGDLSPRHTDDLKDGAKKGKSMIPLQVKTRSSREKTSIVINDSKTTILEH
ncbi:hypothetical protein KY290_013470 [Solanum tuberosum]|uniref:Uncharacterized protein n=1 Tax=Solanum tuberosum TaxID=4113 RepID=A0ABQ7VLU9_SOLTU|nr:hypothetical protein KY289_013591 [Solanum tuberosum]KAH0716897.1 hypothetical protein KY285_012928 [Solanum tuberosum]KAH0769489.1 hypothetical protein KY290_013470 [Solanum tuberosum]